jgi:predicted permease
MRLDVTFIHDIRLALRGILKRPQFAIVVILTLALGIGANTAIFTVVDAVLLRPLAYRDAERLVMVNGKNPGGDDVVPSPAEFLDLQSQARSLEGLAAFRRWNFNLRAGDRTEQIQGAVVTSDFFKLLGVAPELGRPLLPDSSGRLPAGEVVVSDRFWRTRLGGTPAVLGQVLNVDGSPATVVGVMPPSFALPTSGDLWLPSPYKVPTYPLKPEIDPSQRRNTHYFEVVARVAAGTTRAQAEVEIGRILREMTEKFPDESESVRASLVPIRADLAGDSGPALLILLGAAAVLLLIACANLANLFLADATARQREWTVRAALGAGRFRLARERLTESVFLSLLGGLVGLLVAVWGVTLLQALAPQEIRGMIDPSPDVRILGFTAAVALLTGIGFGVGPALRSAKIDLAGGLHEGGRNAADSFGRRRVRNLLVVSEVALAFVLAIGAGLLVKAFVRVQQVPVGLDPQGVVTVALVLPANQYGPPARKIEFVDRALEILTALPAVSSASVVSRLPLRPGGSTRSLEVEGRAEDEEFITPDYQVSGPDYLRSLGIPLRAGREFTSQDGAAAPPVAVVSEAMAKAFWPGANAIGKRIKVGYDSTWRVVVGVAADVRQHGLDIAPVPTLYLPYAQDPWSILTVVVRTRTVASASVAMVTRELQSLDHNLAVSEVRTMDEVVAQSLTPRRFNLILIGLFSASALLLAALGIYGVISYTVAQRTREVGIRVALGAQTADVLKLVVGSGIRLSLAGIVIGLLAALGLTPVLRSLLFGITPTDLATFAEVAAVLTVVALVASYLPAHRATRVDPIVALKAE